MTARRPSETHKPKQHSNAMTKQTDTTLRGPKVSDPRLEGHPAFQSVGAPRFDNLPVSDQEAMEAITEWEDVRPSSLERRGLNVFFATFPGESRRVLYLIPKNPRHGRVLMVYAIEQEHLRGWMLEHLSRKAWCDSEMYNDLERVIHGGHE